MTNDDQLQSQFSTLTRPQAPSAEFATRLRAELAEQLEEAAARGQELQAEHESQQLAIEALEAQLRAELPSE